MSFKLNAGESASYRLSVGMTLQVTGAGEARFNQAGQSERQIKFNGGTQTLGPYSDPVQFALQGLSTGLTFDAVAASNSGGVGSISVLISGTPGVGNTLTASFPSGVGTVKWQSGVSGVWTDIPGATSLAYLQTTTDAGKGLRPIATSYAPFGSPVAVPGTPVFLAQAANRGTLNDVGVGTGVTGAGTVPQMQRRYSKVFGNSGTRFKLRFINRTASGTAQGNGNSTITLRGGVMVTGMSAPVAWTVSGARDVVIAPGAIVETDWINQPFTKGQTLTHIDLFSLSPSIATFPGSSLRSFNAADRQEYGTGLVDKTLTDWTSGAVIHQGYTVHPWADVITEVASPSPSVLVLADSIGSGGSEDGAVGSPVKEFRGYLMSALGNNYSWVNSGQAGLKMIEAVNYTGASVNQYPDRLGQFANRGFTHCIMALGTNDSQSLTGASAFMAMVADAKAKVEALGMKLVLVTLLPRTNVGNTAEYSAGSAASFEAIRQAIIASGIPYFDAWLYARDPATPALWRADLGTPTNGDGLHPLAPIHAAIASALSAALPALLV
ncbi:MAG: hypothetical protein JWP29_1215 [Rhodoferax sp.]|nr:hypothetical protein [Rhodoferax sp.]